LTERVVIGTRGSKLALIQTEWVARKLREIHPKVNFHIEIIKTAGDKLSSAPFAQIGSQGIFVKEIENAILERRVDLAVHSLKDLQTDICGGLTIGAILERESPRDALISRQGLKLARLPEGTVIGTSSARRRGLLAAEGRGFEIRECRGNLNTRIEKLKSGEFDAILLAEAGLRRMGMTDDVTEYLDVKHFVPAVGQGALCIEIRADDRRICELVSPLNHEPTFIACTEERSYLADIGGGCHAPVGGHMYYADGEAIFLAFVGTCDGSWYVRRELRAPKGEAHGIGRRMAEEIKALPGAEAFFEEVARDAR